MHTLQQGASTVERSRASTVDEQPPTKRLRSSVEDSSSHTTLSDDHGPNQTTTAPSVSSQSSVNDHVLIAGCHQAMDGAEARNGPSPSHTSSNGDRSRPGSLIRQLPSIQKFLQSTITLRFGEGFQNISQVHRQLLIDRSSKIRQTFVQSAELKKVYANTRTLRKRIKALLPPELPLEKFFDGHKDKVTAQAANVIIESYNNFPLLQYQIEVKNCIKAKIDELLQNGKMIKELPSTGGIKKRDFSNYTVPQRLQVLKTEAVHTVLQRLDAALWRIKTLENGRVIKDEIKAAAMDSIYLSEVDADTVGSLLKWVYTGILQYNDAKHLCHCHCLAQRLGLQELEDKCLVILSSATSLTIEKASTKGVPLQALLEEDNTYDFEDSLPGIVRTVYLLVMNRKPAPTVLRSLIVDAIANSADPKLVETSLRVMPSDVKGELCLALAIRLFDVNKSLATHNCIGYMGHSPDSSMKAVLQDPSTASMKDEGDVRVKTNPGDDDVCYMNSDSRYSEELGCR